MTSSKNTAWIAGAGVLALLAVVATYFLLIAPKRAEAADLTDQKASVVASNAAIAQQTELLKSEFVTLDDKKDQLAAIQSTLPANADVPQLLRQLEAFAASSGVTLLSVAPGTPEALTVPAGGTGTAVSASSVVDIPLTLSTKGSFAQTELFLKNVQADMGRYYLVQNVSLQAGDTQDGGDVAGAINGKIFVMRDDSTTTLTTGTTIADGTAMPSDPTTATSSSSQTVS